MRFKIHALLLFGAFGFAACKKWDDHIAVTNPALAQTLWQSISADASLSTFAQYAKQTGVDSLLQTTKTFTVWAPTNEALKTLDPAITADGAKLKSFVLNHISTQSYFTRDVQGAGVRVQMLNGKYNNFSPTAFGDATLAVKDKAVGNGVLHTIDKGIVVLPNLWEFVNSTASQYVQNGYIAGLNFNDFDPTLAIVDSINSSTGDPIYRPGTGVVVRNKFNTRVYDLRNEAKQYTYIVVANAGFTLKSDSLKKYYATASATSTDSLAKWNVAKDLLVEGLYPPAALAGLVSKFGLSLPINQADIIDTKKFSNGVAYVVSKLDVPTANKFPALLVQGENPTGFSVLKTANTNYRLRVNPVTGQQFVDLLVSGHATTGFYAFYRLAEVPSIKYKVYALGVNDFQTGTFSQSIVAKYGIGSTATTLATLNHAVPLGFTSTGAPNTAAYAEMYLGDVTLTSFGTLDLQLTASSSANPIVLDYLRLVPQP